MSSLRSCVNYCPPALIALLLFSPQLVSYIERGLSLQLYPQNIVELSEDGLLHYTSVKES